MTIREATEADIPHLLEMGRAFHEAACTPIPFCEETTRQFIDGLIRSPDCVVIMTDGGAIAGALAPAYCNTNWIMAVELAWWATDRRGLSLLGAFERWADMHGADEVRMTTLAAIEGPERILQRRGYKTAEISYQKVI